MSTGKTETADPGKAHPCSRPRFRQYPPSTLASVGRFDTDFNSPAYDRVSGCKADNISPLQEIGTHTMQNEILGSDVAFTVFINNRNMLEQHF